MFTKNLARSTACSEVEMSNHSFQALRCPLDGNPLARIKNSWCCEAGHSYDIAREGYVHLLPVQNKRSKDPGDSKDMVAARRRFLSAEHYAPIAEALNQQVFENLPGHEVLQCLDAGCGEGYYLRKLQEYGEPIVPLSIIGLDISKWAVQAAAKADRQSTWVVGSNANLPLLSGSVDCVLCLFGFPVYAEFARVLRPGGLLLQVDTGSEHLRELREIIYPSPKTPRDEGRKIPEGFKLIGTRLLRYTCSLDTQDAIADLLTMTPHLYRASAEGRDKALALHRLIVSVDVQLNCYKREFV